MEKHSLTAFADTIPIPESRDIENQVLTELIETPGLIPIAQSCINETMFSDEAFAKLWKSLVSMSERGETIDYTTITTKTDRATLKSIMSPKFGHGSGSILSVTSHCEALVQAFARRSVFMSAFRLVEASTKNTTKVSDLLEMSRNLADEVENGVQIGTSSMPISEVLIELSDSIERTQSDKSKGKRTRVPTGFQMLDYLTYSGLDAGNLVILSARPSVGKTAIMLHMAKNAIRAGFPTSIYSLEMTNRELAQRLVFSTGLVDPCDISEGRVDWNNLERANAQFNNLPLYLNDKARTLEEITTDIVANNQHGRCSIAFIDYLGLIQGTNPRQPLYQAIAERTSRLKQLAKQCRIPIVLLCQLNRNTEAEGRAPELYDLRDCGSIEQDADIVLMLERESHDLNNHNINMWVRKNRNGRAGSICVGLTANDTFTEFYKRD